MSRPTNRPMTALILTLHRPMTARPDQVNDQVDLVVALTATTSTRRPIRDVRLSLQIPIYHTIIIISTSIVTQITQMHMNRNQQSKERDAPMVIKLLSFTKLIRF